MVGKVFCAVDADHGALEVADLLTTSATAGHAIVAHEGRAWLVPTIGKALRPFSREQGLIPTLLGLP